MSFWTWLRKGPGLVVELDRMTRELDSWRHAAETGTSYLRGVERERDDALARADQAEARAEAAEARAAEAEESRKHCHEVLDALQDDLDRASAKAMQAMQPKCIGGES